MPEVPDVEIIRDIRQVAERLGSDQLSRSQYLQHGRFSMYHIYDGGRTWEALCSGAGIASMKVESVPDEVYLQRLQVAVQTLGRVPKVSERKRFGLQFSKRRYPTLKAFLDKAAKLGIIPCDTNPNTRGSARTRDTRQLPDETSGMRASSPGLSQTQRPVPPIPVQTRRTKWERTRVDGFPYAPQDELGVVALFAILCSRGVIGWQILELRGGKGIDATCFDHVMGREIRVELKHVLSQATWNHKVEEVDYVVCWENRWLDFPKPVTVLRDLVSDVG